MEGQYKSLIHKRAYLKESLTSMLNYFNSHPNANIDDVTARQPKLEEMFSTFNKLQFDIEAIIFDVQNSEALLAAQSVEKESFSENYYACATFINQRIRSTQDAMKTLDNKTAAANNSNVYIQERSSLLPKIEIKPFDGNPLEWHSFHDTFHSLVHSDAKLPAVQKFHILKNALRGSVSSIMDSLNACEENYYAAWEMLIERCDRPRQIVYTHIKSILELPEIVRESPSSIRNLKEKALMHYKALESLSEPVESWNSILVYVLIQKLDKLTRRTWERTLENSHMPTFNELVKFLNKHERGDETETINHNSKQFSQNNLKSNGDRSKNFVKNDRKQTFVSTQRIIECGFCKSNHLIYGCEKFLNLSAREKWNAAKTKGLCINCLRGNHSTVKCHSSGCRQCHRRHHSLLHFADHCSQTNQSNTQISNNENSDIKNDSVKNGLTVTQESEILMGTARVYVLDKDHNKHECRVLLDGCSQAHFITEKLAEKLKLPKNNINSPFAGLGQLTMRANYSVKTKMLSRTTGFESELELIALPVITNILPSKYIDKGMIPLKRKIKLADPEFNKPAEVDILIGTNLVYKLLCNQQMQLTDNSNIILQNTLLGWIVTGEVEKPCQNKSIRNCCLVNSLDNQLVKFWSIEEVPNKKHLSAEEQQCETLYLESTQRDNNGRYVVRLPFNEKKIYLGDSYNNALKRFYSLERKLLKSPSLMEQYREFIHEYEQLGHMKEIEIDCTKKAYYIPHHAVIKENSYTTKLRVVFDASAKSTSALSLNDALLVGPTVHDELIFIIMRFRLHNVVLTADLKKMYRQIKVNEQDSAYQRILWRDDINSKIQVFELTTVTQGTASAPFLASRTLQQLALDEGDKYPAAAQVLMTDFYVDDLLTGVDTLGEAKKLKQQLVDILESGGFELHKWASNKLELTNSLNVDEDTVNINHDSNEKTVLGIHWNSSRDSINYSVKSIPDEKRYSKRIILSQISQLFDPLGILGPIIIVAKLLMQELWKLNLMWDEDLPQLLTHKWINFKKSLSVLHTFSFPRQITIRNSLNYQLHGFCDASEQAYGACVYLRSTNYNETSVKLVCSKSRVAPLKTVTLPRLELCAAHLLTKLITSVASALKLNYNNIYMWSDSTITLHWLKMSPDTLKTFVANRVTEIQTLTSDMHWNHISTKENPADHISRGQTTVDFIKNKLWMNGPSWIIQHESEWNVLQLSDVLIPDQRIKNSLNVTTNHETSKNDILGRFSTINSLNRFVALCFRWLNNSKCSKRSVDKKFTIQELQQAHFRVIKLVQGQYFSQDIKCLQQKNALSPKSKINSLSPVLDSDGILRVGGRLVNAKIEQSKKYPILLPRDSYITKLIIIQEHNKNWHAGVQGTLNAVRNKYWPVAGKSTTRKIIHKCVRCIKFSPKLPNYVMGNLPEPRVMQARPFQNVGIDYCGPFLLKERKFRNKIKVKAYVSVFVCFATKAVHLELVTDLTTESCLEAIKRFIARRGKPSHIYSDNATNFVGAKNEMVKVRAFFLSQQSKNFMTTYAENEGIEWHFIPPRAPHFGGLWEAAVKSFKTHLYRTVGDAAFTYEQFNTFIIEIESILNSRPITPLSADPNDLIALTPSHFLIVESPHSILEHNLENIKIHKLSMWQRIMQIKQHFWRRWHKEYLNELRTRSKWHEGNASQIQVGTLVLIKEENTPPMHWSMGRILQLHPGEDNITRVVTLKTANGTYKRCVKKLAPLPID